MKIPLPCKFGELSDCDGKLLPLCGVHWFDWMSGRQYTYFFETGDQWHPYTFYETRQEQQPFSMEIPDDAGRRNSKRTNYCGDWRIN